jgi:hypothetical protein
MQGVSGLLRSIGYKSKLLMPPSGGENDTEQEKERDMDAKEENEISLILESSIDFNPTIARVNQIRGHGKQYGDAVTVTVTALLDPPPHYILRPSRTKIPVTSVALSRRGADSTGGKITHMSNQSQKKNALIVGIGGLPGHYTLSSRTPVTAVSSKVKPTSEPLETDEKRNWKKKEGSIMDQSARILFEQQFLAEVAAACYLSSENITIEEVKLCQRCRTVILSLHITTQNLIDYIIIEYRPDPNPNLTLTLTLIFLFTSISQIRRLDFKDPRLLDLHTEQTAMLQSLKKGQKVLILRSLGLGLGLNYF